ncbi:hypothetical protein ACOME3_007819 [Neoechinorhynchus agilis]
MHVRSPIFDSPSPEHSSLQRGKLGLKGWVLNEWKRITNVLNKPIYTYTFDCGISDVHKKLSSKLNEPRIYGGNRAKRHAWPWAVTLINFRPNYEDLNTCGGSLVNADTVITAAHCVSDGSILVPQANLKVIVGAHTLAGQINPLSGYSVKEVIPHPMYKGCCYCDIAIVKLSENVKRSKRVNTICLPRRSKGVILGWGLTALFPKKYDFVSFVLRQGNVTILSDGECAEKYDEYVPHDELCAMNYKTFTDARLGDSGGPLMVMEKNRWVLVGVTSHGLQGEYNMPGFYSNVKNKMDFLAEYL